MRMDHLNINLIYLYVQIKLNPIKLKKNHLKIEKA